MQDTVIFRNLDKVRFIVQEATNLDVAYAFEDLVFGEHGIFIIRFNDEDENMLYCYFNKDCIPATKKLLQTQLTDVAFLNGCKMIYRGTFEMDQEEGASEFELKLYEV